MGCLKYCFSGLDDQDDPVFLTRLKDEELLEAPMILPFSASLRFSCVRLTYREAYGVFLNGGLSGGLQGGYLNAGGLKGGALRRSFKVPSGGLKGKP